MRDVDFLREPTDARLLREIRNISDSYSHPWDPLAELCQNAVDAIRQHIRKHGEAGQTDHRIEVTVNARDRAVTVSDTGVGMPLDEAPALLAPSGTSKARDPQLIGEKGVGLTYTIFTCNDYRMESRSADSSFSAHVRGASDWKHEKSSVRPSLHFVSENMQGCSPDQLGTTVTLGDVESPRDGEDDLFAYNHDQIAFILRTNTAIGCTATLFGAAASGVTVLLNVVDAGGNAVERMIPFAYCSPEEAIQTGGVIGLSDFLARAALMTDAQKGTALKNKAIRIQGSVSRSGRSIKYYGLFAPSRRLWREIGERLGALWPTREPESRSMVEGGILVATKGMPTGVVLEPPQSGSAGYWPNYYIVVEDDAIVFDVGRKYVPSRTKGVLKEVAKEEIFEKVRPIIQYVTSDPGTGTPPINALQQAERAKEFDRLRRLPELGVTPLPFLKHPDGQESAVAAIFNQLVGAGVLRGYKPLACGYKTTYDMWGTYLADRDAIGAQYTSRLDATGHLAMPFVLEFKFGADSIIKDWQTDTKYYTDIDIIVCWDYDEMKLSRAAVTVRPLPPDEVLFHGTNFQMEFAGSYNLGAAGTKPLLCLRQLLERMR